MEDALDFCLLIRTDSPHSVDAGRLGGSLVFPL